MNERVGKRTHRMCELQQRRSHDSLSESLVNSRILAKLRQSDPDSDSTGTGVPTSNRGRSTLAAGLY